MSGRQVLDWIRLSPSKRQIHPIRCLHQASVYQGSAHIITHTGHTPRAHVHRSQQCSGTGFDTCCKDACCDTRTSASGGSIQRRGLPSEQVGPGSPKMVKKGGGTSRIARRWESSHFLSWDLRLAFCTRALAYADDRVHSAAPKTRCCYPYLYKKV